MLSIIVPVYNSTPYLHKCIESVIKQSSAEWELILIDDGSADESGKIIDAYADEDEKIHAYHQENRGQFFARKSGIEKAQGDYVMFLDSDDELEKNCVEEIGNAANEHNADIILYEGKVFANKESTHKYFGKICGCGGYVAIGQLKEKLLFSNEMNSLCTKAFKRELFFDDGTDYSHCIGKGCGEDKVMALYPVSNAKSACYVPKRLYRYNYRDDSVTHKCGIDSIETMLMNETFSLIKKYMSAWHMDNKQYREMLYTYYLKNYLEVYYNARKYCKAHGSYRNFRKYNWKEAVDKSCFRCCGAKNLSIREKTKLFISLIRV